MTKKKTVAAPTTTGTVTASSVWTDVTDYSKQDSSKKVSVELSLDELHMVIVGLLATARDLEDDDLPKTFHKKADQYSALMGRLDKLHDDNSFPKAMTVKWEYAK